MNMSREQNEKKNKEKSLTKQSKWHAKIPSIKHDCDAGECVRQKYARS